MYNIIKYWKYVLNSDSCIIVACYKIMHDNFEILGLKIWVYFVKKLLSQSGFSEFWD